MEYLNCLMNGEDKVDPKCAICERPVSMDTGMWEDRLTWEDRKYYCSVECNEKEARM